MEFLTVNNIDFSGLIGLGAVIVGILATCLEVSKIKINPWSSLLRWAGRALNADVLAKVEKQEKKLQSLEDKLKVMHDAEGERNARAARTRVLRFGDEILHGVRHSKEHFDDILLDISDYNAYCDTHKGFKNGRMQLAIQHIEEVYSKCMKEHNFL